MSAEKIYPVPAEWAKRAWVDDAKYNSMYAASVADPDQFWGEHGKRIDWIKPFTKVQNASFEGDVHIAWYEDGTLNASYNCIDRHLPSRAEQTAILWEGDDPRDRGGHACLCPDRGDPFGRVRRLLARQPGRPHSRLSLDCADNRR